MPNAMEEHRVDEDDVDKDPGEVAEPEGMSWVVVAFMSMCLVMTAAMAYYAWGVFERAV
jgi:hypothetical protein